MIDVFLPHEGENHVIGVKVARRLVEFVALEFHAFAQMEGVDLAVFAHVPALGQAWYQLRSARFKIDQAVIDRNRTGIHAGAGGIKLWVKILRRSFRAIHQCFCRHGGTYR
ncbi:hypothetical protein D3C71_1630210 [compost metagenome]